MTKAKLYLLVLSSFILASITFLSCGDDETDGMTTLDFKFDFKVDNEDLELNKVYDLNGSKVSFLVASYYLGGLKMTERDGAVIDLSNDHFLAGQGNLFSTSATVPSTELIQFDFFIGVDPSANAQSETDFTSRMASDPLGMKDPSMHWNWNSGYKFIRIDGQVDIDGDDIPDTSIAYHIGSDPLLKNLSLSTTKKLYDGQSTISFVFDLNEFLASVDFQIVENQDTHTGNNLELAQLLVSNLDSAISVE